LQARPTSGIAYYYSLNRKSTVQKFFWWRAKLDKYNSSKELGTTLQTWYPDTIELDAII
jgi:hypothetical protein